MALSRVGLIIALIGLDDANGISGITRMQKLLYLLEKESNVTPAEPEGFEFTAYKMGPYSSKLYDDLEMMENLGLIETMPAANPTEPEAQEAELSFDNLMSDSDDDGADVSEERRFRLTARGKEKLQEILTANKDGEALDKIRKTKSRFATYSLQDILHYVYTKYPESTTESEIKDRVLKRMSSH